MVWLIKHFSIQVVISQTLMVLEATAFMDVILEMKTLYWVITELVGYAWPTLDRIPMGHSFISQLLLAPG